MNYNIGVTPVPAMASQTLVDQLEAGPAKAPLILPSVLIIQQCMTEKQFPSCRLLSELKMEDDQAAPGTFVRCKDSEGTPQPCSRFY